VAIAVDAKANMVLSVRDNAATRRQIEEQREAGGALGNSVE
jgi:hypothetical protein